MIERGQVNLSKQGKLVRFCMVGVFISQAYCTLSMVYSVWFMYLSYKWKDIIKVSGVKIPSCADKLARLGAHRGKISPIVHRVHLHEMGTM